MHGAVFFNTLAVVGVLLLLFGFFRSATGKWTGKSFWYEFDNLLGSTSLIIYQVYYHAYVTAIANAIWAAVAAWGLFLFFQRLHAHARRRIQHKAGQRRTRAN